MRLSKREKILVILLALFLVAVAYYELVFLNQRKKLTALREEKETLESTYNSMTKSIGTMAENETKIKISRDSIEAKSMKLYPNIYQDKIIIEINDLLSEAGIKGNLSFSEVEVSPVAKYFGVEGESSKETVGEPSLKESVEEIRDLDKENKVETKEKKTESKGEGTKTEELLVDQMQVTVDFSGAYEDTTKFIKLVSDYARLVAVPNITLVATGDDNVAGTLNLEFYSIPKFTDEDKKYLDWTLDNTYGKANPFKSGSSILAPEEKEQTSQLSMSINGNNSDLPSMALGKTDDSTRDTYIYFDKNDKVDVNVDISEEDGKFYVKYKTKDSSYPSNYEGKGVQVDPGTGRIKMDIYSTSRGGAEDKVGVNLNISNTASKIAEINIIDEDKSNPRVVVQPSGLVEYFVK